MNEQIYSLAEQASEYAVLNPSDKVLQSETEDAKVEIPKAFIDKFAELIVKECIDCADFVGQVNIASGYPNSTAHHVKQKIKQHFGVEE